MADAPTLRIRRILREEWPALRELRLEALRADPLAFGGTWAAESAMPEERWKARAAQGADAADAATLVAVDAAGRFLGMTVVVEEPPGRSVYGMWVRPEARGRGVGGRLLDRALAWTGTAPRPSPVRLEVNPNQRAAVGLYRSRGFEFTEKTRPLDHTPGAFVQEMVRPAGPAPGSTRRLPGAPRGPDRTGPAQEPFDPKADQDRARDE